MFALNYSAPRGGGSVTRKLEQAAGFFGGTEHGQLDGPLQKRRYLLASIHSSCKVVISKLYNSVLIARLSLSRSSSNTPCQDIPRTRRNSPQAGIIVTSLRSTLCSCCAPASFGKHSYTQPQRTRPTIYQEHVLPQN